MKVRGWAMEWSKNRHHAFDEDRLGWERFVKGDCFLLLYCGGALCFFALLRASPRLRFVTENGRRWADECVENIVKNHMIMYGSLALVLYIMSLIA